MSTSKTKLIFISESVFEMHLQKVTKMRRCYSIRNSKQYFSFCELNNNNDNHLNILGNDFLFTSKATSRYKLYRLYFCSMEHDVIAFVWNKAKKDGLTLHGTNKNFILTDGQ